MLLVLNKQLKITIMKTFTLLMVVAMATVGTVSAQNYTYNQRGNNRQQAVITNHNYGDADRRTDDRFVNNQRSAERYGYDNRNGYNDHNNSHYATTFRNDYNRFDRDDRRDDRRYDNDRRYNDRDDYNRTFQQSHRRF
jgi:hypothetical protein